MFIYTISTYKNHHKQLNGFSPSVRFRSCSEVVVPETCSCNDKRHSVELSGETRRNGAAFEGSSDPVSSCRQLLSSGLLPSPDMPPPLQSLDVFKVHLTVG